MKKIKTVIFDLGGVYFTDGTKGAPVYVTTNYDENVHYTVIAIHSYGHSAYSRGTRITPDLLQFGNSILELRY